MGEFQNSLRLLVVEATGSHPRFNEQIVKICSEFADVTYLGPSNFIRGHAVQRVDIPDSFLERTGSRLRQLWRDTRILSLVNETAEALEPQAVLFTSYETLAMALRWRRTRTLVIEHNNLDSFAVRHIGRWVLRPTQARIAHLAFCGYIVDHLRESYGSRAFLLPFPYDWDARLSRDVNRQIPHDSGHRAVFVPSSTTREGVKESLIALANESNGRLRVAFKGSAGCSDGVWESSPYFLDYEHRMSSSDIVLVDGCYDYRVSAVAYERLSLGRPVTLLNCRFARELKQDYPSLVRVIEDVSELLAPDRLHESLEFDHSRFLAEHGSGSIREHLERAIRSVILSHETQ